MSTSEEEQSLERLLHASRTDPGDAQLRRLEGRFETWLAESAPPQSGPFRTALRRHGRILPLVGASLAVLVLGIGLFQTASNDGAPATREARRPNVPSDRVTMATEPSRSARLSPEEPAVLVAKPPAARIDAPAPKLAEPPAVSVVVPDPIPSEPVAEVPAAETSETEVSYLRRSRAALRSEPERALSIANDHPARFPHGALDQERELIAIDALVRLGRSDEARARADRFRARYPSSAHLGRVSALVGGQP